MTLDVVIRNAEVDGRLADVTWSDGVIQQVSPPGVTDRARHDSLHDPAFDIDADGGALLPGLHDHHIHLLALAAARRSADVGPPAVTSAASLATALCAACDASSDGWVRAVGYHESVAGELDADALDRLVPAGRQIAIRVQHRSGQMWVLNSHALEVARVAEIDDAGVERDIRGRPTGRIFGLDAQLRERIPVTMPDLAAVGRELAGYGVTGVTDLTPTEDVSEIEALAHAVTATGFALRVTITGGIDLPAGAAPSLPRGPVKFLPTERELVDPDVLADGFRRAHAGGRPVAVHCVTRLGLVLAIWAWRAAGVMPGDRIEHGGVVPEELFDEIRDLGLLVVTQPNFVAERGDEYLADVEPGDRPALWRCGSLDAAGIALAGGTDAPFGHPDPWRAMAAAVERTTRSGVVLGTDERVSPEAALRMFTGDPLHPVRHRSVRPGTRTDLCLLDRPWSDARAALSADAVRLTIARPGITPTPR